MILHEAGYGVGRDPADGKTPHGACLLELRGECVGHAAREADRKFAAAGIDEVQVEKTAELVDHHLVDLAVVDVAEDERRQRGEVPARCVASVDSGDDACERSVGFAVGGRERSVEIVDNFSRGQASLENGVEIGRAHV